MKKIIYLFLLFAANSYAQSEHLFRNSISVGVGIAKPLGNLAETNIDDTLSGYGKNGLSLYVGFNRVGKSGLGIYGHFKSSSIGINESELKKDAEAKLNSKAESFSTDNYSINSINIGLLFVINKNHKFQIVPQFGFGLSACRNRTINGTFNSVIPGIKTTWDYKSDKKTSLNFMCGIDFSYKIKDNIALFFKSEWQLQAPQFKYENKAYVNGVQFGQSDKTYFFPMFIQNNMLGIKVAL